MKWKANDKKSAKGSAKPAQGKQQEKSKSFSKPMKSGSEECCDESTD